MLQSKLSKLCRICRGPFAPWSTTATVCSVACARRVPIEQRRHDRARVDSLRPRGYWLLQAQKAFNAWVRERDRLLPCISCSRYHQGAYDAGHYLTVGARPELRFDEQNCHAQCVPCNQHLHGNLVLYRRGLVNRLGIAVVEWLEGPHEPKHYTVGELQGIRDDYRARLRAMTKERAT